MGWRDSKTQQTTDKCWVDSVIPTQPCILREASTNFKDASCSAEALMIDHLYFSFAQGQVENLAIGQYGSVK